MDTDTSRPIGLPVLNHTPGQVPEPTTLTGAHVILSPLSPSHAPSLFPLLSGDANAPLWDYMFAGPFASTAYANFLTHTRTCAASTDPLYWTILSSATHAPLGLISYLRIDASNRVLEIGNISFSHVLQRTTGATEAVYLLLRHAFETLGYRRCEWKCNSLNAPSIRAAGRLGFTHEGVFRKHMVVKGRNRDTWWASIVDDDWEGVKRGFEAWLAPGNFDGEGRQRRRLEECREDVSRGGRGGVGAVGE